MKLSAVLAFLSAIVLGFALAAGSSLSSVQRRLTNEVRRQFTDLSRGQVHYELTGESGRPVVLLISGPRTTMELWNQTVPRLMEGGYQVLRYDHYGSGLSASPENPDLNLYRQQLAELLTFLNLPAPFYVVGHGEGAALAADFGNRYPSLVKKMVFVGPESWERDRSYLSDWLSLPVAVKWLGDRALQRSEGSGFERDGRIFQATQLSQYESPAQLNQLLLSFFSN